MRLHLVDLYRAISEDAHCPVNSELERSFHNVFVSADGEVFIDAASVPNGLTFSVFARVLRAFLDRPCHYVLDSGCTDPSLRSQIRHLVATYFPRLMRVKVKLPADVDNTSVTYLCNVIPFQREPFFPLVSSDAPRAPSTSYLPSPDASADADADADAEKAASKVLSETRAVVESIDATDCVYVSLLGGRQLRDAARRNIYLRHVFVSGCSLNAGTARQLHRATKYNRALLAGTSTAHSFQEVSHISEGPPMGQSCTSYTGTPSRDATANAGGGGGDATACLCFDALVSDHDPTPDSPPFWRAIVSSLPSFQP